MADKSSPYRDQAVWIIGASSGIGAALAEELSRRGAALILSARSEDKLTALADKLPGPALVAPLDVTKVEDFERAFASIEAQYPQLARVIYMAGSYDPAPIAEMDMAALRQILAVNLTGPLELTARLLPRLKAQSGAGAQIVYVASVAGYRGLPNGQPYSLTKAALINFAESLRIEQQGKHGLDIRLINPGFVRTPMTAKNDFAMPMAISAEKAARYIADGLVKNGFEIVFPRRFGWIMKGLQLLPGPLYRWLARRAN